MPVLLPVTANNLMSCVDFLLPKENRCVTLASHFSSDGKPVLPDPGVKACVVMAESADAPVEGIILVSQNGILLHCIGENSSILRYAVPLQKLLSRLSVRSVIGEHDASVALESLLPGRPSRTVDYRLMTFDPEASPPEKAESTIVRCGPDDTDALLPLQEGYEKEEVLAPDDLYDREVSRKNLQSLLAKQCVYMAVEGGKPVAKAGTNALGIGWVQLGGVYTLPEWRGKGLARTLVRYISDEKTAEGRKTALFVKLSNESARKAYEKAGFKPDVFFRISYR